MKFYSKLKQYGFKNSIIRFIKSIFRKIGFQSEKYLYFTQTINVNKIINPDIKIEGDIRQLTIDIIENSEIIHFTQSKIQLFRKRLKDKNYKGYGFFVNNKLVYYTWISLQDFEMSIPTSDIHLNKNEGLLIDSYCHPDFRGFGIHAYMNDFRLQKIFENGKRKAVAIVLKENIPARKTQKKSGFECHKIISYKKFLKWEKIKIINKNIELA